MKIVNVHQYGTIKDAEAAGVTYLGRPTVLGNPYSHLDVKGTIKVATREESVSRYKEWLWSRIKQEDQAVLMWLRSLREDSVLGCWCAPKECHCEVLIKAHGWLSAQPGFRPSLLFWSQSSDVVGRILSNFWIGKVQDDMGNQFHSAEQCYFWHLCIDEDSRSRVLSCGDARNVKAISKELNKRNDTPTRLEAMKNTLRCKFADPELAQVLKDTGDAELIHWAPWGDTFWGVSKGGDGLNTQGIMLMELRSKL
jgi:predicted NAD-dependent protein-ADP-ribosyltransferase YbiA (DUF1768 family)